MERIEHFISSAAWHRHIFILEILNGAIPLPPPFPFCLPNIVTILGGVVVVTMPTITAVLFLFLEILPAYAPFFCVVFWVVDIWTGWLQTTTTDHYG